MKQTLMMTALCAGLLVVPASAETTDLRIRLTGRTTKSVPFYAPGEKMAFEVRVDATDALPDGAEIELERTGDDGAKETKRVKAVAGETVRYETSLAKPGFVRVLATLVDPKGTPYRRPANKASWCHATYFAELGAGVEPEKLASVPEPKDFDAFCASERAFLSQTPPEARVERVAETNGLSVYAVRIACAGPRPVTGYLQVPVGARAGKRYPARLLTQGWGTGVQCPPNPAWYPKDVITFEINAHGYELGRDADYYKAFFEALKTPEESRYAFDVRQNSNRETAYFRGMRLRVMRALEFLKARPEWNGRDLWARGGSQGGLQTVWAASCGLGVTKAEAEVPWCCDIGGTEFGRNRGDTDRGAEGPREPWFVAWTPALGYFDPVNHARRVPRSCEFAITRAGLGDYVCPPTGISILYNNLSCPKSIVYVQGSTHGIVPPAPNQVVRREAPAGGADDVLKVERTDGIRIVRADLGSPHLKARVIASADPDGKGPLVATLIDPNGLAASNGLCHAINANAFRHLDGANRDWRAGDGVIVFGSVVTGGVELAGCEQTRTQFWIDRTNVCHIGRMPKDGVREAVSDWGCRFLKDGEAVLPKADSAYPRSCVATDASGRFIYLMTADFATFGACAAALSELGATDALSLDGGGSAVLTPCARKARRPVPVMIGVGR